MVQKFAHRGTVADAAEATRRADEDLAAETVATAASLVGMVDERESTRSLLVTRREQMSVSAE